MKLSKQTKVLVVDVAEVEQEEEVEEDVVVRLEQVPEAAPDQEAEVQLSSSREEQGADLEAEDLVEDLLEAEVEQLLEEPGPDPGQSADGSMTGSRVQEVDLVSA